MFAANVMTWPHFFSVSNNNNIGYNSTNDKIIVVIMKIVEILIVIYM